MNRLVLFNVVVLALAAKCAVAQVVQLPTFHQFSTSTTVSVPDRGSASLGGVRRSATGGNQFGAPGLGGNRAGGAAAQGGGLSVSAQIHDFAEMDRRLLEQAAAMRGDSPRSLDHKSTTSAAVPSVAEIRRQKAAAANTADAEAVALLERADDALKAGRQGAAKVYYQMAIRRATGPIREVALAKYQAFKTESNSTRNR